MVMRRSLMREGHTHDSPYLSIRDYVLAAQRLISELVHARAEGIYIFNFIFDPHNHC